MPTAYRPFAADGERRAGGVVAGLDAGLERSGDRSGRGDRQRARSVVASQNADLSARHTACIDRQIASARPRQREDTHLAAGNRAGGGEQHLSGARMVREDTVGSAGDLTLRLDPQPRRGRGGLYKNAGPAGARNRPFGDDLDIARTRATGVDTMRTARCIDHGDNDALAQRAGGGGDAVAGTAAGRTLGSYDQASGAVMHSFDAVLGAAHSVGVDFQTGDGGTAGCANTVAIIGGHIRRRQV